MITIVDSGKVCCDVKYVGLCRDGIYQPTESS